MRAASRGDYAGQSAIHVFRGDELTLPPTGEKLA